MPPKTAYDFLVERSDRLATALDRNHDVAKLVQGVLEHVIDHCEQKGVRPEDVVIDSPQVIRKGEQYFVNARIR